MFIAYKMTKGADSLNEAERFGDLDESQNALKRVTSFEYFIFDDYPELLRYASEISKPTEDGSHEKNSTSEEIVENELLRSPAKQQRRNRVSFPNTPDEVAPRLNDHPHIQKFSVLRHCASCGSSKERRRTKVMCTTCNTHLRVRVPKGWRKAC